MIDYALGLPETIGTEVVIKNDKSEPMRVYSVARDWVLQPGDTLRVVVGSGDDGSPTWFGGGRGKIPDVVPVDKEFLERLKQKMKALYGGE